MSLKKLSLFFTYNQQLIRRNSSKSLILKSKTKKKSSVKKPSESFLKKVLKSKAGKSKAKFKARLPSDYCEDVWLDNVKLENLKLFRKTSFGSFRKIRLNNLIQKLKQLECDSSDGNIQNNLKKISPQEILPESEDSKENQNKNFYGQPQMSEYLVHNMTAFPLLKTNCNHVLSEILKNENEEYGLVDTIKFPSVTAILNDTMPALSKFKLKKWKTNLIAEMGEVEFKKHLQDLRKRGSNLHSCLKEYFRTGSTENVKSDPYLEKCWESLEKLLPNISDVKMIEETLYHPALMYKGIVDCVASYEGNPCVIDWKKSEKEKHILSDTFDAPLQVSAYLGALCWRKNADPLTKGMVVVVYTTGKPATIFKMDSDSCEFYWLEWLRRLQTYWLKRSSILDKAEANF